MALGKTQLLILAAIAASCMFLLYSPALYSLDAQAEATQPQLQSPSTIVLQQRLTELQRQVEDSKAMLRAAAQRQQQLQLEMHAQLQQEQQQQQPQQQGPQQPEAQPEQQHHEPQQPQRPVAAGSIAAANVKTHPILALSDAEFRSTDFDTLYAWYGEADGAGSCADDFGHSLVRRWRNAERDYCSPTGGAAGAAGRNIVPGSSKIRCAVIKQTRHAGNGDAVCNIENVALDTSIFADSSTTSSVIAQYVASKHLDMPYIHFPKGVVSTTCAVQPGYDARIFPGWNEDWVYRGMEIIDPAEGAEVECDEWIDHQVLVVQRDTFANFFHDSEDFFNVFVAMAVLRWSSKDTQIFLTDLFPEGPFWDIWSRVYNGGKPPITAWDLKEKYGKAGKTLCFKNLGIGIYGPAAPITVASFMTTCSRTGLVRAYSDYVIRGLNLQHLTHYAQPTPRKEVVITWMARRASVEWPEKRFCSTTSNFFDCKHWDGLGLRKLGRMVRNDAEVIAALRELEQATFANGAKVKVQDVDYNLLSFEEQIKVDLQTDIMIGPHGAGLMHNIFMRDRAVLIELFVDGSQANKHFHNLARWFGRDYVGKSMPNPVPVQEVVSIVRGKIAAMDLNSY